MDDSTLFAMEPADKVCLELNETDGPFLVFIIACLVCTILVSISSLLNPKVNQFILIRSISSQFNQFDLFIFTLCP